MQQPLKNAWQHGEPPLLIAPPKLAPVPRLLLPRPDRHLRDSDPGEDHGAPAAIRGPDAEPRQCLKEVVGAGDRHEAEHSTGGYAPLPAAVAAQPPERQVRGEVTELADGVQRERKGGEPRERRVVRGGARGGGRVRAQGYVGPGEEPVVRRVLENVGEGHRGGGEAMNEERLELTLEEVEGYHGQRESLRCSRGREGRIARGRMGVVKVGAEEVDEWVEEEGPEVFDYEDCAPGDLGSCGDGEDVVSLVGVRGPTLRPLRERMLQLRREGRNDGAMSRTKEAWHHSIRRPGSFFRVLVHCQMLSISYSVYKIHPQSGPVGFRNNSKDGWQSHVWHSSQPHRGVFPQAGPAAVVPSGTPRGKKTPCKGNFNWPYRGL